MPVICSPAETHSMVSQENEGVSATVLFEWYVRATLISSLLQPQMIGALKIQLRHRQLPRSLEGAMCWKCGDNSYSVSSYVWNDDKNARRFVVVLRLKSVNGGRNRIFALISPTRPLPLYP